MSLLMLLRGLEDPVATLRFRHAHLRKLIALVGSNNPTTLG